MLPPIPIPDVAGRLSAMANQATLAPIQQASALRGQVFQPPAGGGGGGGLAAGLPALGAGIKGLAGAVKQNRETDAMAEFVRNAIGPEQQAAGSGKTPVEGMPWLKDDGSQTPPEMNTMSPDQSASMREKMPAGATAAMPDMQAQNADAAKYQLASNPLGFNQRQVAVLRGMIDSGSRDQIAKAANLVMMKAFEAPPEAQSALGKLINDMKNAPPGMRKFYEDMIARETAAKPAADARTSDQKNYEAAKASGFNGSFTDYQQMLRKSGAANTEIKLPAEEGAYAKEIGKLRAQARGEIATSARQARGTISRVKQTQKLLNDVQTGAMQPTFQTLKRFAKSVGMMDYLNGLGVKDDVGAAEALVSVAGQFMMDYIQQTKGAISEKENELFASFSPGLSKTPEGNRILLDWTERLARRQIDMNKLAAKYESENGSLDAGWEQYASDWQDANPILSDADVAQAEKVIGSTGGDSMNPSAPGTSAPLPGYTPPTTGTGTSPYQGMTDEQMLEALRKQGYQIPR